ncbi:MAG: MFS transporter [Cyclobacteriaceae bacterium]|nr:MFS transporter [Cyclobacteriaceae bacterium HetDA_MAG_MS6]
MILAELPDYLKGLGGGQFIGLIIGLATLSAALSRPFSGKLTDKWGRVPVMVLGSAVGFLVCISYPLLTSVFGFLFLRFMHGFATGFKPTGTAAYVADIVPENSRGEAMGIASFFSTTGMAMGPSIGSWIFLETDINTLFYTSSAFSIGSILILFGMKETLKERKRFSPSMMKIGKHEVFEHSVLPAAIVMLLTMIAFGTILTLSPDFSRFVGIENKGLFFSFYTFSSMISRVIGGKTSDKVGRVAVLKLSSLIIFGSMIFIGFAEDPVWFLTGALIYGIGNGLTNPTLFAWTVDLSPNNQLGKGIATTYIFLELGIFSGSFFWGSIYGNDPDRLPWLYATSGLFSLVALIYLFTIKPQRVKVKA